MSQSPSTRKQCDFTKLMMAGYKIDLASGGTTDFYVKFFGPKNTPYESGIWRVHVTLPEQYPFSSPSIGFVNKILHPNIDETSGSVCLDVINQTWTPLYSLVNIFEVFLPQLLTYPNPTDPLNAEAASLLLRDKNTFENAVREHVTSNATEYAWERTDSSCSTADSTGNFKKINDDDNQSEMSELSILDSAEVVDIDIDDL
eukprot:GHVL01007189.1.p1 GENE.GHVL01007189.1~~GHVL01007189.1.p1  ORF type:complete len:201 (+),score=25.49 GHVL01007189.1:262-864(+)